jgi:hypothetical protein
MPGGSNQDQQTTVSGPNGAVLYDSTSVDIDKSELTGACLSGVCSIRLDERIWSDWTTVINQDHSAGAADFEVTREVDSDVFDGDHRLIITAKADNTAVRFRWLAKDV